MAEVVDHEYLQNVFSQVIRVGFVKIIILPLFTKVMNRFDCVAKYGMSILCLMLYLLGPTVMLFGDKAHLFSD